MGAIVTPRRGWYRIRRKCGFSQRRLAMTRTRNVTAIGLTALFTIACSPIAESASATDGADDVAAIDSVQPDATSGWRKAQLTTFTSYPACCPGSPVYDP